MRDVYAYHSQEPLLCRAEGPRHRRDGVAADSTRPGAAVRRLAVPRPAFGQRLIRTDAARLVGGGGRYLDDLDAEGVLHAAFFRSPHAHAHIDQLELGAARVPPGSWRPTRPRTSAVWAIRFRTCTRTLVEHPVTQRPLALDDVHYAGQPIAMVVAEDRYLAEDALSSWRLSSSRFRWLRATSTQQPTARRWFTPTSPTTSPRGLLQRSGDPDAAFASADVVIRCRLEVERSAGMPLETRGLMARWDADTGHLEVWDSTQNVVEVRDRLADVLGLPPERVRVAAPDVEGASARRSTMCYPEEVLVPFADARASAAR